MIKHNCSTDANALRGSIKNQAKNLMNVYLGSNYLDVFCDVGSITVVKLTHVKINTTVHQTVSTVSSNINI